MGKEAKKRKRSRSPSRERRRGDEKTEAEWQKMKVEILNLKKLFTDFVSQRREEHRVEKISTENAESANKKNVQPQDEIREEVLDTSAHTEEEEKVSQKESCDVTIAEEILTLLGDDPNAVQGSATKLHPEIKNRWETWMKEGLAEDIKKTLTKKYSRKGDLYTEPPKVNLEISAAMTDIAKKRDDHFVQTQECVGTAIVSLGAAVSLLIDDSDNEVDQMKLIELLCDTGKLLADVFHQQSVGRKSFITPMLKKSVKPVVESTHSDEWLYGQKLADQIKEVIHGVHVEPAHVIKKRSISQPLRILLSYDESVYRLDAEKFELINNTILPEAVHFWERALMVRETKNTIRLNRKCESSQVFVKDHHTHCIDTCRSTTMCGEVVVPDAHLDVCRTCNATGHQCGVAAGSIAGEGINGADFVFYVSAMQTERCHKGLTVAYAAHCQQEAALDRPIAGHANLCPGSISTKPQELETLLSTVKHEILHALGFSVSLYAFYRDENGEPRTSRRSETGKPPLNEKLQTHQWSESTIRTVTRPHWQVRGGAVPRSMQMIVTPRVQNEVRSHFNCPSLEGAELEDQGEDGTALTHWEKRVFENEAMTGTHTQNPVYSRITLALMEDTGWYSANYSMAQELGWGRHLGCDFSMKSCKEWISSKSSRLSGKSIHPFCNKVKQDPLQTECTDDRSSVALCNLIEHPLPLPRKYQNFDSIPHVTPGHEQYYGGSVSLADYCPYIQEFTWRAKNIVVRGSHCLYEENNPQPEKNFALEKYGGRSRCFDHTNQMWEERTCKQARQWQHWGSGCYQYKCEAGRLHIMVANYTYTCYHAGQEIAIRIIQNEWLHKGALICPPCKDICQAELQAQGERCKPGDEHPPSTYYHRDNLDCGVANQFASSIFTLTLSIILFVVR